MTKSMVSSEKLGVTRVTGVTALIYAAYSVTPFRSYGVTGVTTERSAWMPVTLVTPQKQAGVTRQPACLLGVTHVTPVTPTKTGQKVKIGGGHE